MTFNASPCRVCAVVFERAYGRTLSEPLRTLPEERYNLSAYFLRGKPTVDRVVLPGGVANPQR